MRKNKKTEKVIEPKKITVPAKRISIVPPLYKHYSEFAWKQTDDESANERYEEIASHIGQDYIFRITINANHYAVNLKNYNYVLMEDTTMEVEE